MATKDWTVEDARFLYNVPGWSQGYFDVQEDGQMVVCAPKPIAFSSIIQRAKSLGLSLPLLVRFPHIVQDRIKRLEQAFSQAILDAGHTCEYQPVYPIKVNQHYALVSDMLKNPTLGLEVGSKAELMAALSLFEHRKGLIICNGYKDQQIIDLCFICQKLGHDVTIVIEKLSELPMILSAFAKWQAKPQLGLRIRLTTIGKGNWQNTGGEKSKFGLTTNQVLEAVRFLKTHQLDEHLSMIHAHLGSQIANIEDINQGMREVTRWYTACHELDLDIKTIDVGGGLGVDYEGSQSNHYCSMNYTLEAYANTIVTVLSEGAKAHHLPMPRLISESGRALVAHHAVLLTEVVAQESALRAPFALSERKSKTPILNWFAKAYQCLNEENLQSTFEACQNTLAEAHTMFIQNRLSVEKKALVEQYHAQVCYKMKQMLEKAPGLHPQLKKRLDEKLATKTICNFSLFQSLPDIWALKQIFPILPTEQLHHRPSHQGLIRDITCDSDGRIDHYVQNKEISSTLSMPDLDTHATFGVFMVGAYQEILGDRHNLFANTHSVHVIPNTHGFELTECQEGWSLERVLQSVYYDTQAMMTSFKHQIEQSMACESMKEMLERALGDAMLSPTYLNSNDQ